MSITYPGRTLNDLFDQISKEKILIPNFQREFVWERDAQKKLLASLITHIPIGSFLFLTGQRKTFSSKKIGYHTPFSLDSETNEKVLFLLDGQQRISCLFSVFYDFFYNAETVDDKNQVYDSIYQKLKNRWFLRIKPDEHEDDLWGFTNLRFDPEKIKNAEPADIEPFIEIKKDLKNSAKPYSPYFNGEPLHIINFLASHYILPLYSLFPQNDNSLFTKVLRKISNERMTDLKNSLSEEEQNDFLINNLGRTTFDDAPDKNSLWYELSSEYQTNLKTFFAKIFESYTVPTIELPENEINRSIYIFENLNKGGTRLSTFDLVVAKVFTIGDEFSLRDKLRNTLSETMKLPASVDRNEREWNGDLIKAINQKDRDIAKEVEDQFLNLLSILINSSENVDNLRVEHIKQKAILELPNDKINEYLEKACKGLKRALAFLQFRCAITSLQDLSYKLMILPIAYLLNFDEVWDKNTKIDKLEYWYWLSLFSGRYRERQNERCIEDIKELYKFLEKRDNDSEKKLNLESERFKNLMNAQGYSDKAVLLREDKENEIPAAIRNGILQFILSRTPSDLNITASSLSELEKIEAIKIASEEQDVEIHHIIPLAEAANLGESTQKLRKDKNNILNSPLNLTIVIKQTNRDLKTYSPSEYLLKIINNIGTLPLHDHFIPNDHSLLKRVKDSQTEENLKEFCDRRYQEIKRGIEQELRELWNS